MNNLLKRKDYVFDYMKYKYIRLIFMLFDAMFKNQNKYFYRIIEKKWYTFFNKFNVYKS